MPGFQEFGYASFIKHSGISKYLEFLSQGKIMATRCSRCNKMYFPPRKYCSRCFWDGALEWVEYPYHDRAKLISYSILHFVPAGFDESEAPFIVGIAEFPDGNRIYARIQGVSAEEIELGMELRLVPRKLDEHRIVHVLEPAGSR